MTPRQIIIFGCAAFWLFTAGAAWTWTQAWNEQAHQEMNE